MIPVVSMDKDNNFVYQIFNDNLSPVECVNRELLAAILKAQKLTNIKADFDKKVGTNSVVVTDAMVKAAQTLVSDIEKAISTFETEINK